MQLTPSAAGTETAPPIPSPPQNEVSNPVANATIKKHAHLFAIVTPINANRFQRLLTTHPNRPLVDSMIRGLREGFWPYAETEGRDVPDIVKYPNRNLKEYEMTFVRQQRDEEIKLCRYSTAFADLLPGMQTSPIGVVPKPHSDKFRMIVDQSKGKFALNSYVSRSDGGVRLDTLSDFKEILLHFHKKYGRGPRWIFKTDVSQAYRRLPAHPLWQIKQVMEIDGQYHVNRCIDFGGRGSGKLWCLFFGLVVWVAIKVRGIEGLCHYVDDAFGFDDTEELVYYAKYGTKYPVKQVRFLQLLDEIGCPHDKPKQLFFRAGTILGLCVDVQSMTITLPKETREELIKSLRDFISKPTRTSREWQTMLGVCNWALEAYPLLRPALQSSIERMHGHRAMSAEVMLNGRVKEDLKWFADRMKESNGLRMLELLDWGDRDADAVVMCDACVEGLGFWDGKGKKQSDGSIAHDGVFASMRSHTLVSGEIPTVDHLQALCVVTAIDWYSKQTPRPRKLLVHTASMNAVSAYNSLHTKPEYNAIAKFITGILLRTGMSPKVQHVSGERNTVAEAISQQHFQEATRLVASKGPRNSGRRLLVLHMITPSPQLIKRKAARK